MEMLEEAAGMLLALVVLAVILAFPLYVFIRLSQLKREISELRGELDGLREGREGPRPITAPAPAPPPRVVEVIPAPEARELPTPEAIPPPVPPPAAPPPPRPPRPPAPRVGRRDFESVVGANWLSKLGVIAILVSAAFFLKYAFEAGWIGPTLRVAIGLLAAGIFLGLGQYLVVKPTYRTYAQVLAAGGIVILFLSIWAAFNLYHLIGFAAAFAVLAAAALAISTIAVKEDTQAIALFCILGAFATPVLLQQETPGAGNLLRLYGYLAGLNLWAIVLIKYRPWYSLPILSLAATWLLFFQAGELHTTNYLAVETFAALFLLFSCYDGVRSFRTGASAEAEERAGLSRGGIILILAGCTAFVIASIYILAGEFACGLPALALVGIFVALLLVGLAGYLSGGTGEGELARQVLQYVAAAALLIVVGAALIEAEPLSRAQASAAFFFSLFIYLLFLAGSTYLARREDSAGPGAVLLAANAILHIGAAFHALGPVELWRHNAAVAWLPVAGVLGLAPLWLMARWRVERAGFAKTAITAALLLEGAAFLGALALFGWQPGGKATLLFLGEFVLVSAVWLAARRLVSLPRWRGDLLAAFCNAAFFFGIMAAAARMGSYQGVVILCGVAVVLAVYHALVGGVVLRRPEDDTLHRLIYLGLALTFITIALPLQLRKSYLSLAWAAESVVLIWTGLAAGERRVRWYGAALLFITAAKALLWDLSIAPAPFRLLLNERMLSGGAVIAAGYVSAHLLSQRRDRISSQERSLPAIFTFIASLCVLLFVSFDLWDYLGKSWEPYESRSSAQQLALSIFWSSYGLVLMLVGIWRQLRAVRLFAMGLLYLAIFKVFIFDLGSLATPFRIISFLGLGIILLVVSLLYTRFESAHHEEAGPVVDGADGGAPRVGGPAA